MAKLAIRYTKRIIEDGQGKLSAETIRIEDAGIIDTTPIRDYGI